MSSSTHGAAETERLKKNLSEQTNRLLMQLQDLEDLRDEIDDIEYAEIKEDTLEQLQEVQDQLNKFTAGDMTLVSEFGAMKLALRATIANAFKTPEVIRLFAQKEPNALRARLAQLREANTLGRLNTAQFNQQATEIIVALKKLNETLNDEEKAFLRDNADAMRNFETADKAIGDDIVSLASTDVRAAMEIQ